MVGLMRLLSVNIGQPRPNPWKPVALTGTALKIFVPSVGGISHSPRELTRWEDCARGAQVLLDTALALAGRDSV